MMQKNAGLVQTIVIIVLSLIILSLLGVSLRSLFTDSTLKENFAFAWEVVQHVWTTYVAEYARWGIEKIKELVN